MPKPKKKPPVEKKEKDPYAPWLSNWFITYNTNRSEDLFIPILDEAWKKITNNIMDYLYAYKTPRIRVIEAKQHYTIEKGPKFGKIHMHADLTVDSEGLAMLDYVKIRKDMNTFIRRQYRSEYWREEGYRKFEGGACWVRLTEGANRFRLVQAYLSKAPLLPLREALLKKRVKFD